MDNREPLGRNGDDMDLPAGKTCGDCVHCRRCTAMFGHIPADESCDWSPSRFREAIPAKPALSQQAEPLEQAPAQDEREAFEAHMRLGGYSNPEKHPDGSYVSSAMELWWQGWKARAARPAQTEQQPIRMPPRPEVDVETAENLKREDGYFSGFHEGAREMWDDISRLNSAPIAQTAPQGTTSDKYRAELYDEVWEKARSMGYGNVTNALTELERMKATPQPEQSSIAGILKEMRERRVNHGKHTSPTLEAWADRIEAALPQGLDTKRLEWMIAEGCVIESQNGTGSPTVYRVVWPRLGEAQTNWYPTEREAIDHAQGGDA